MVTVPFTFTLVHIFIHGCVSIPNVSFPLIFFLEVPLRRAGYVVCAQVYVENLETSAQTMISWKSGRLQVEKQPLQAAPKLPGINSWLTIGFP